MNIISVRLLFAIMFAVWLPNLTVAQTDFFFSTSALNEGAINENLSAEFETGESASVYIWYTTNGPANSDISVGAILDIISQTTDVIQFTAAETFNFDVIVENGMDSQRWQDRGFGETGMVTDNFVDDLFSTRIGQGTGILEANTVPNRLDLGYDKKTDAFLWGKLDFIVLRNPWNANCSRHVARGG